MMFSSFPTIPRRLLAEGLAFDALLDPFVVFAFFFGGGFSTSASLDRTGCEDRQQLEKESRGINSAPSSSLPLTSSTLRKPPPLS